ncbi:MAG: hypothetical protein FWE50_02415 [Alphaproteobacteria bacterium]|nr:hypothetical protein [Alphaproteobacteria bacterium]
MKIFLPLVFLFLPLSAHAFEYDYENWNMKLTGYGTAGGAALKDDVGAVTDWMLRGQVSYRQSNDWLFGAVVSQDAWGVMREQPLRDAFAFVESPWGRAELGFTTNIATKLGLGLPDVGGLRVNMDPVIYQLADPYPVLSRTTVSGASFALRANIVSVPTSPVQFGFSYAPKQRHFDNAADFGLKYKFSEGKTKTALSLGASFIDRPDFMAGDIYAPRVTADWRGQFSTGLNLQYNSWIWGLVAKVTYDQNPTGALSDGLAAGTGISYDLLNWSASVSYMFSEIGIFHDGMNYLAHTGILSLRYKFNQYLNAWISGGFVDSEVQSTPFISGGLTVKF